LLLDFAAELGYLLYHLVQDVFLALDRLLQGRYVQLLLQILLEVEVNLVNILNILRHPILRILRIAVQTQLAVIFLVQIVVELERGVVQGAGRVFGLLS
jgi:hypothetical protein